VTRDALGLAVSNALEFGASEVLGFKNDRRTDARLSPHLAFGRGR
jgi:hypothetical protein